MMNPLVDAFMSVGSVVAGLMLLAGGLRMLWGDRFEKALCGGRQGPLVGALLSLPPGCVGVLTAVGLYGKGRASFGTAIAALTATMGDSAWLLFAAHPLLTLKLKLLLGVLGCVLGYAIDALAIDPARAVVSAPVGAKADVACSAAPAPHPARSFGKAMAMNLCHADHAGSLGHAASPSHHVACGATPRPALSGALALPFDSFPAIVLFWVLAVLGLAITILTGLQLPGAERLDGRVNIHDLVGIAGFAASCVVFLASRNKLCCEETAANGKPSLREVLETTAKEVAFVTVWTGLAFLVWEGVEAMWLPGAPALKLGGVAGVVLSAAAGLIPACGVEILFASLFLSGTIPLSALVTYLVSEDGSGLIPLAALQPRSAVASIAIKTVPALIVGFVFLSFGQ